METQAIGCKPTTISLSLPTRYFIDSIQATEFETKRTILSNSEIVRMAIDFLVEKKYPHLFNDVKEFIKE
jgi:hypothetical protein